MTSNILPPHADPDIHKGAIEGDHPADEQQGNPHGDGIDKNGMPNDPVATARTQSARMRTTLRVEKFATYDLAIDDLLNDFTNQGLARRLLLTRHDL